MEMVIEEHKTIVEKCLDRGLVAEVCKLRDTYNQAHEK